MYDFGKYPKTNSKEDNMNEQLIINAVQGMSDEMIKNVLLYIDFLKFSEDLSENNSVGHSPVFRKHKNRTFDTMKGRIEISDGFDEIPEGFEDYIWISIY